MVKELHTVPSTQESPQRFNTTGKDCFYQEQVKSYGKGPYKCWTCGENHLRKDFPQHKCIGLRFYNTWEVHNKGNVARGMLNIYKTLKNRHENHQDSIIDMEVKICNQTIYVLVDPGSNYRYIGPMLVE